MIKGLLIVVAGVMLWVYLMLIGLSPLWAGVWAGVTTYFAIGLYFAVTLPTIDWESRQQKLLVGVLTTLFWGAMYLSIGVFALCAVTAEMLSRWWRLLKNQQSS
ncbi:hypothetical protein HY405_01640 [Candidatus Microgenomates bacterium]|nr:hypothetical protein [Candidatus Microgenomates bacterium]